MGQAAPDSADVLQVNVGASGKARLIMRNKGNFRLLLNASIWPGMKVTPMDGGKVGPSAPPSAQPALSPFILSYLVLVEEDAMHLVQRTSSAQ